MIDCVLFCGFQGPSLCPLQQQQALLPSMPSFPPSESHFIFYCSGGGRSWMKVQQNSFSIVYSPEFVDNHLLHSEGRDTIRFFEIYLSLFYAYECFVCMKVCL